MGCPPAPRSRGEAPTHEVHRLPPSSLAAGAGRRQLDGRALNPHGSCSLVNLLRLLLDLGLISVLQVLTGFPEAQVLPCEGQRVGAMNSRMGARMGGGGGKEEKRSAGMDPALSRERGDGGGTTAPGCSGQGPGEGMNPGSAPMVPAWSTEIPPLRAPAGRVPSRAAHRYAAEAATLKD